MAILDDVKVALRISSTNTAFDGEINGLILAAKADLGLSGVVGDKIIDEEPLIKRAVITYTKANFGYDNPEAERFQTAYNFLKMHLALATDYAFYSVTFTITDSVTTDPIRKVEIEFDDETLTTDANGQAIFYVRKGSNYEYSVTADGYAADDDENNLVDVSSSQSVSIALVAL